LRTPKTRGSEVVPLQANPKSAAPAPPAGWRCPLSGEEQKFPRLQLTRLTLATRARRYSRWVWCDPQFWAENFTPEL